METDHISSRVKFSILVLLSFISLVLSFQLFIASDAIIRTGWALSIFLVIFIILLFIQRLKDVSQAWLEIRRYRIWLLLSMTVTLLFIILNNTYVAALESRLIEALYLFTIIFCSCQPLFLFDAVVEPWMRKKIQTSQIQFKISRDDNMPEVRAGNQMAISDKWRLHLTQSFDSITKKYVGPSAPTLPCPHCSFPINFNKPIEWLGPSALKCMNCNNVVNIIDIIDEE